MTGHGTGTIIPASTATAAQQIPAVTLAAYSRIMRFDPALFMGVKLSDYKCDPYTADQREQVWQALVSAYGQMDTWVTTHSNVMIDTPVTIESTAPYFELNKCTPGTLTTHDLVADITYFPGAPLHHRKAQLDINLGAIAATDNIYDIAIMWDEFAQKRLNVELMGSVLYDGMVVTVFAKAYNFIDVDNIMEGVEADDAVPYLTQVPVRIRVLSPSVPLAYWPIWVVSYPTGCYPTPLAPPCEYQTTEGTLKHERGDFWHICDYGVPCRCGRPPTKYELPVIKKGIWTVGFDDAVISFSNCLVDETIFKCNPLSLYRWRDDQGIGEKWDRVYRYSFWNPFGILAPGAQKAYSAIRNAMQMGKAFIG